MENLWDRTVSAKMGVTSVYNPIFLSGGELVLVRAVFYLGIVGIGTKYGQEDSMLHVRYCNSY